jgi:predicted dehydrogenase
MADQEGKAVNLTVLGAGLNGGHHIDHVRNEARAELLVIVNPSPEVKTLAALKQIAWHPELATIMRHERPDGMIVATPNDMRVANGLESVAAGVPALIEKPIADDVAGATRQAEAAGVPLLVGHHCRHNLPIHEAKEAIDAGQLGQVVAAHATCWIYEPDDYSDIPWRRGKGAGPVFLNLIRDGDLLRHLCGDVVPVQALESNLLRGNEVEETAVILLRFANGILGTVTVSDKIVAAWSWECTNGENPACAHTQETCYTIGGTRGSLSVPYLDLWHNEITSSWWDPIKCERLAAEARDPLGRQVQNLRDVIRGTTQPVVSGREAPETLKVIAAVKQVAATGGTVDVL